MSPKRGVERRRGNRLGFWFFRTAVRLTGLGGAYGLLYGVSLHYLLFDRPLLRETLSYVRRRFPEHGRIRQLFDAYRLFVSQGKNLIDRYALAAGYKGIEVDIEGYGPVREILDRQGRGFILLTAHVGNWQVAMSALRGFGRTVHLMMRPEDNAAVRQSLEIDREEDRLRIISTDDGVQSVVEAMKAIENGDLVSIMGDRPYDFSSMEAELLGGRVRLPYGAFSIAAAARCPVVVLLSARTGMKRYVVDVSHIIPPPEGARGKRTEATRAAVQEFAGVLEAYAMRHPWQWFVFRDIWEKESE